LILGHRRAVCFCVASGLRLQHVFGLLTCALIDSVLSGGGGRGGPKKEDWRAGCGVPWFEAVMRFAGGVFLIWLGFPECMVLRGRGDALSVDGTGRQPARTNLTLLA